jgi:hypothetical protein
MSNNDITTTTTMGSDLTVPTSLPGFFIRDLPEDQDRVNSPYVSDLHSRRRSTAQDALDKSQVYLGSEPFQSAVRRLELAERPATDGDIAKLFALVLSFPNAGKNDLTYFQVRLSEFIDTIPRLTVGDIELTIRKLEDECKFVPTIAEIWEAMKWAHSMAQALRQRVDWSVSAHDRAIRRLSAPKDRNYFDEWDD